MTGSAMAGKIRPSVLSGVPEAAHDLIWRTFFADVGRGVDFAVHLPWHANPAVRTVLMSDDAGKILAAAVIRPARQAGVAMAGYVCVDACVRGRGYGRELIAAVNEAVNDLGYRATLLWTGKPEVYVNQGYAVVGRDDFVHVKQRTPERLAPVGFAATAWPGAQDDTGLPAFAVRGRRLRFGRAEAIVAEGARGVTLVGWKGGAAEVAGLLVAGGHTAWSVNLPAGHDFVQTLLSNRYDVRSQPGATAMIRCSDPLFVPDFVPVTDRI